MRLISGMKNIKGGGSPMGGSLRTSSLGAFKSSMVLRSSLGVGYDLKGLATSAPTSMRSPRTQLSGLMGFVRGLK